MSAFLIGLALATGTLGFGVVTVIVVSRVSPNLSLVVALLTYTLQIAALLLVGLILTGAGVDPKGLAAGVGLGVVLWVGGHLWLHVRGTAPIKSGD